VQAQKKKATIALIPGLTTDAFLHHDAQGAKAAADRARAELFPGRTGFNPRAAGTVLTRSSGGNQTDSPRTDRQSPSS